jgi:hypothetical protein
MSPALTEPTRFRPPAQAAQAQSRLAAADGRSDSAPPRVGGWIAQHGRVNRRTVANAREHLAGAGAAA